MRFRFPAKTFLLGEYVALQDGPAILLTTEPCFEATVTTDLGESDIHPESPAGLFWSHSEMTGTLTWFDPYDGIGGLGASSAQFLAAYFAKHPESLDREALQEAYWKVSYKTGVRPSGYDVLAQAQEGCVYLHRGQSENLIYDWPFTDIAFVLLHTGEKLATHHHLQTLQLTHAVSQLAPIVYQGKEAFDTADSALLIEAVNHYHEKLLSFELVTPKTKMYIERLSMHPEVLALKGCGALGADVMLALVPSVRLESLMSYFSTEGFSVLASTKNLYSPKKSAILHENP